MEGPRICPIGDDEEIPAGKRRTRMFFSLSSSRQANLELRSVLRYGQRHFRVDGQQQQHKKGGGGGLIGCT